MRYRALGKTGLRVSEVGLGCSHLASVAGRPGQRHADRLIGAVLEAGITLFDTAGSYGAGWGERRLGHAIGAKRDSVVVITKYGQPEKVWSKAMARVSPHVDHLPLLRPYEPDGRFQPGRIERAVERSLQRLGMQFVDVLLLHSPPADVLSHGRWTVALRRLRDRGLIRLGGVSTSCPEEAEEVILNHDIDCVEFELNPRTAERSRQALALANERGIGVIARQVFGSGSLFESVADAAGETGVPTRSQVAAALLHFVLQLPDVSAALVGTTSPDHILANTYSSSPPELTSRVVRLAQQS